MNGEQNIKTVLNKIKQEGKAFCHTKGFSMLPMLKEGRDISVIVSLPSKLKPGDVVLFIRPQEDNELVLHRIIKFKTDDVLLIRGDNTYRNEYVRRENIIAFLEGFFHKGKYYDCKTSAKYRMYSFLRVFFYPIRRFFRYTLRVFGAKIKNNVFHLYDLHIDDIFKKG